MLLVELSKTTLPGCASVSKIYALYASVLIILIYFSSLIESMKDGDLCLEDDYTDLPIFIEKKYICDYEASPVHIYYIKVAPDAAGNKFCLRGESATKFNITKERELQLLQRLGQSETILKLQLITFDSNKSGTPGEQRTTVNAIQFIMTVTDCNQVSWQTILVAVLSSACVVLMSTLAIMLILYQQKGLIRGPDDDERAEGEKRVTYGNSSGLRDESFINPRRTSSYEFSTLSRNSASTIERGQEVAETKQ